MNGSISWGGPQRPAEARSPLIARFVVTDHVRSQLEQHRAQLPICAMPVERVIDPICRCVRLIIPNMKLAVRTQQLEKRLRQPTVIPRQYTDVPGPSLFPINRRETVNRHDLRCVTAGGAAFDHAPKRLMIRLVDGSNTSGALLHRKFVVARNESVLT